MRIGMVSIWFDRGQSEVTRTLRQALIDNGHEVFIFGRMGGVYGQEMQEKDAPYWKLPNVYFYPKYKIPVITLVKWAQINRLDAVVFNEEYDFNLPAVMQDVGLQTIHYVDFIADNWRDALRRTYHQLWSATKRTTSLLGDLGLDDLTTHIGWGIPDSMPYRGDEEPQYDFFHNAGWLGINFRKGTDLVLLAFDKLRASRPHSTLLVHAQVPQEAVGLITQSIPGMTWRQETCPHPGLYHLGRVVVQPSRMEGLGLTIPEAMWQGRAVISTDAPPMNEFVTSTTHLVPIVSTNQRADGLSFPECVADVDLLAQCMLISLRDCQGYGLNNFAAARRIFDWASFRSRIAKGLNALEAK